MKEKVAIEKQMNLFQHIPLNSAVIENMNKGRSKLNLVSPLSIAALRVLCDNHFHAEILKKVLGLTNSEVKQSFPSSPFTP